MPHFVILEHDHPDGLHYDFMLEIGASLKTWSLAEPPESGVEQSAELLPNHRLAYLDYEGPVSGGRGTVKQWDRGTYRLIEKTYESIMIEISGEKFHGQAVLAAVSEIPNQWKFHFAASQ
jgi:hypothetical protein